jgi:hypothetical protein
MRKSPIFYFLALLITSANLANARNPKAEVDDSTPKQLNSRQKLAEFAKNTRLKQPATNSGPNAEIYITNENLPLISGSVNLTEVTTSPVLPLPIDPDSPRSPTVAVGEQEAPKPASDGLEALDLKREYWRNQYLKGQQDLAKAESDLTLIDEEIPRLWNVFYSTDDPAYRDREIKPRLNAVINQRETAVTRIDGARTALLQILGDAKRDGALPGWFRDIK